jgi:hypothetical protein
VREFVRDNPTEFGLAGDKHQTRRYDQGSAVRNKRSRLFGTHHVDGQLAVPVVVGEDGLEGLWEGDTRLFRARIADHKLGQVASLKGLQLAQES